MASARLRRWLLLLGLLLPTLALGQAIRSNNVIRVFSNDTGTGTTRNLLAKVVPGGPNTEGKVVLAATTDTARSLVLVRDGAGTTGSATVIVVGEGSCIMDATNASNVAGQPVIASTSVAGRCHTQASPPASGMVIATMISDATSTGVAAQVLMLNQAYMPGSGPGTGTVTSVGLVMPAEFTVSGSPVSVSGTITVTEANETAHTVYAGPPEGGAAAPDFRTLVPADLPSGWAAGGDLSGTYPNPSVAKAAGTFALTAETAPTALGGNVNDYAGCTTATCYINGGATDRDITGFAAPALPGDIKDICNAGTTNLLTLKHQSGSSSAANRMDLSDDVRLMPGQCHALKYHLASTRWQSLVSKGPAYLDLRPMGVIVGDPGANSPPLQNDNDSIAAVTNDYGRDYEILTVACLADAGSPVVRVQMVGGSATSVLSSDCTCGTAVWAACAVNGVPVLHSFSGTGATCTSTPCAADFLIVTAGGTAKYLSLKIQGRLR